MRITWKPPKHSIDTAILKWGAGHAAIAHEGATLRNGTKIPPRRWTQYALNQQSPLDTFADSVMNGASLDKAFRNCASRFYRDCEDGIRSDVWSWPRATKRVNGEVAGSPRNIVDTGELADSQSMEVR